MDSVCNVTLQMVAGVMGFVRPLSLRAARLQGGVVIQALGFNHLRGVGERRAIYLWRMLKQKLMGYAALTTVAFFVISGCLSSAAVAKTTVPFVGCPGINMEAPTPPTGDPFPVDFSKSDAKQLSLYVGANIAALGPRGWTCDESDGPAVAVLEIYQYGGSVNTGPAVIFMVRSAQTPTNDRDIASYGRQYFPKIVPSSRMPDSKEAYLAPFLPFFVPRYAHDIITYINDRTLVFTTPKNSKGLGTLLFREDGAGNYFKLPVTGLMGLLAGQGDPSYLIYFLALRKPDANDRESQLIINFARECIARNMNPVCNLQKSAFGLDN